MRLNYPQSDLIIRNEPAAKKLNDPNSELEIVDGSRDYQRPNARTKFQAA